MGLQLSRAVQSWEPVQERVPLHAWLHPWLEMLGPQLEDLYPPIRFKLATALQAWHPSDASALALLSPWHKAQPCLTPPYCAMQQYSLPVLTPDQTFTFAWHFHSLFRSPTSGTQWAALHGLGLSRQVSDG